MPIALFRASCPTRLLDLTQSVHVCVCVCVCVCVYYYYAQEDEFVRFVARRWYVEHGERLVPGLIQSTLHELLPKSLLSSGKSREAWTQSILASFENMGFTSKKHSRQQVIIYQSVHNTSLSVMAVGLIRLIGLLSYYHKRERERGHCGLSANYTWFNPCACYKWRRISRLKSAIHYKVNIEI